MRALIGIVVAILGYYSTLYGIPSPEQVSGNGFPPTLVLSLPALLLGASLVTAELVRFLRNLSVSRWLLWLLVGICSVAGGFQLILLNASISVAFTGEWTTLDFMWTMLRSGSSWGLLLALAVAVGLLRNLESTTDLQEGTKNLR